MPIKSKPSMGKSTYIGRLRKDGKPIKATGSYSAKREVAKPRIGETSGTSSQEPPEFPCPKCGKETQPTSTESLVCGTCGYWENSLGEKGYLKRKERESMIMKTHANTKPILQTPKQYCIRCGEKEATHCGSCDYSGIRNKKIAALKSEVQILKVVRGIEGEIYGILLRDYDKLEAELKDWKYAARAEGDEADRLRKKLAERSRKNREEAKMELWSEYKDFVKRLRKKRAGLTQLSAAIIMFEKEREVSKTHLTYHTRRSA